MAWTFVLLAGLMETTWVTALRYSQGFTRLVPSVVVVAAMTGSLLLAGQAMRTIPMGTVYAAWTGIGATGAVTIGIYLFNEPATAQRLACIGLIVAGIAGLRITA
ncbi:MAG: multidrug efflux SMR transporter [Phycisphaeraceae bacterium]